jgi:competence protein ComEA
MSRSDRILVAAGGSALLLLAAAAWVLFVPVSAPAPPAASGAAFLPPPSVAPQAGASADGGGRIVVDVQGAVAEPGVRELVAGSRVADAIEAAGGYGADADLAASATEINLAALVIDGGQIRVPRVGEAVAVTPNGSPPPHAAGGAPVAGGPVNLNSATPEQLEALPGIGPVTVQKIVAARQEQPFASLEDAVTRGVLYRGQLEDIQGLATAG